MAQLKPAFFTLLFFLSLNAWCQSPTQGNLVIVGGGLEADNASIYHELIALAGGAEKASFAVIPAASGVPVQSYISFRNILIGYHVKPEHIHLINIAMADDDSTLNFNEAEWRSNGMDTNLARIIKSCSGVWFTGGDQTRIIKTLHTTDGAKTPVLKAVWEVYQRGGVLGGSSAGAAIMSEQMIGGGTSLSALSRGIIRAYEGDDFPADSGLLMMQGLGFFPHGMVDQHFSQRSRLARLAVAMMQSEPTIKQGFGIDENTALIYYGSKKMVEVAGPGGITLINSQNARISYVNKMSCIEKLLVNHLEEGDTYDITRSKISPAPNKKPTRGNEYYKKQPSGQAGVLCAYSNSFLDLLTVGLINNKMTDHISNISFLDAQSGFQLSLQKTVFSEGFWAKQSNGPDQYTVTNILMDIIPVTLSATPMK